MEQHQTLISTLHIAWEAPCAFEEHSYHKITIKNQLTVVQN